MSTLVCVHTIVLNHSRSFKMSSPAAYFIVTYFDRAPVVTLIGQICTEELPIKGLAAIVDEDQFALNYCSLIVLESGT